MRDTARKVYAYECHQNRENVTTRLGGGTSVNQEVERISKEEVWENTKRMKNGKAVCPDDIPVDVCK